MTLTDCLELTPVVREQVVRLPDVHVGDLVVLHVDGVACGRRDGKLELYAGYVASATPSLLGLSVTPRSNAYHGYDGRSGYVPQHIVEIETHLVTEYAVLEKGL